MKISHVSELQFFRLYAMVKRGLYFVAEERQYDVWNVLEIVSM